MSNKLDIYACRSCEHTQYSETKPISCERCGGSLSKIQGVSVVKDSKKGKYAHELSRESRHNSAKESVVSARRVGD